MIYVLLAVLLFPTLAGAQEFLVVQSTPPRLEWGMQPASPTCTDPTPNTMVQTSTNGTSGWATVATVPITTLTYNLPATANNLYYRVATACPPPSNIVQYVATTPPPTDPNVEQRLTAVETKNAAQDLALSNLATADTAMQIKNAQQDTALASHNTSLATLGSQQVSVESRVGAVETKNTAQDGLITNLTQRIVALENAPAPQPTTNITATQGTTDTVNVFGLNCVSLKVSGSGLSRTITCVH